MFEYLSAYLEVTVSPEQKQVIMDACTTLVDNGFTDHEFVIEQELGVADSLGGDTVASWVAGYLLPVYRELLGEFGIVCNDSLTLSVATDILKSLQLIENYDDPESINALCATDDGPEAALADVLQLLGASSSAVYLSIFTQVNPDLIVCIEELASTESSEPLPSQEVFERARKRLVTLFAIAPNLIIRRLLDNEERLGIPIESLIGQYRDQLETLPADRLAAELIGFLLASDIPNSQLITALGAQLDQLHLDGFQVTRVDVAAKALLQQVIHE